MTAGEQEWPPEFLERLHAAKNRRARIVIEHILEHGYVTTEELKDRYGYNHPPRAAKDVRDEGIPLVTFRVKSGDGRSIAAYRFGDPQTVIEGRRGGRIRFPKRFKDRLYALSGGKCAICNAEFAGRELQIDHRVPYEIAGDAAFTESDTAAYLLVCGSCNRAKSWSCEHCPNWAVKSADVCRDCYWASPEQYSHIATRQIRRADIVWDESEIADFDAVQAASAEQDMSLQSVIKVLLRKAVNRLGLFLSMAMW